MLLTATTVRAQIKIAGNVYGGGNAGDMTGNTSVTVRAGDIHGGVYGGARQADVGGHAFVNIDGKHMSDNIVINYVYGGNDIAGKVGESIKTTDNIPAELLIKENPSDNPVVVVNGITPAEGETNAGKNTKQYSAFVLTTKERTAGASETQCHIFIGQLFGGGNGDYTYSTTTDDDGNYTASDATGPIAFSKEALVKPELSKTYLELRGGTIAYAYGGGNNATVTVATDICVDNSSDVTTDAHLKTILKIDDDGIKARMKEMGLNTVSTQVGSNDFQFARVFGGNNKAEMAIQPKWHLLSGKIRNLYSGGNQGAMTHRKGLLLEIQANSSIVVDNVFGGCRMAAVRPLISGTLEDNFVESSPSDIQLQGYNFPAGLSARVLVRGGDINNVYGGNDISGDVTGGNAVGIYASVRGDVYGGGNGSYAYTDNDDLKELDEYRDFYYDPSTASSSVDALNAFRPNAQSVSIRVLGTADKTTVIGGAIYCGGNSATLRNDNANQDAASELKIGSYVIADKVFLGNNGANMVTEDILKQLKSSVTGSTKSFSTIDLTNPSLMEKYMDGCAMKIKPRVIFDADYIPYSTMFGSFYCGGNVGSMKVDGAMEVSFNDMVVIFDKVVGGSNNANVDAKTDVNAKYQGGLLGSTDENGNKLILNFGDIETGKGLKIQPKRWKIKRKDDYTPDLDSNGNEQYELDQVNGNRILEWNTVDSRYYIPEKKTFKEVAPELSGGENALASTDDLYRRLTGGNIYGGCCESGIVNGNVVINVNASIVDRDIIFDEVETDDETGEEKLYGNTFTIKKRNTGVILGQQGMDVLGSALNIFGGGKGLETEIWGSATVNLNRGYVFQIFGGSEEGAIGKRKTTTTNNVTTDVKDTYGRYVYEYNPAYSTYVNLSGSSSKPGVPKSKDKESIQADQKFDEDLAECEFMYGGGFEGPIAGDTHINLGNGRIFNSFAGSCNADIQGHTETIIGANGFPYVRDYVYGGNDLGGEIKNTANFKSRVRTTSKDGYDAIGKVYNEEMLNAGAYIEYIQGRAEKIFGGCYGVYDYTSPLYDRYFYSKGGTGTIETGETANIGKARPGYSKPKLGNAFINFRPEVNNSTYNTVGQIYGAGQGYFQEKEENLLQNSSYILIDVPKENQGYQGTEVFGGGECGGVGMGVSQEIANATSTAHKASAVIDLARGHFKTVYGGSYKEGITRRTIVNVPAGSTFQANSIFGGAYGFIDTEKDAQGNEVKDNDGNTIPWPRIDVACDVYEANVNYNSSDATIDYAIYGGNNACRRTLYGKVNINAPVKGGSHWTGLVNVYGAGYGENTWSQYTEVNLNNGARVQEVYGGGENGLVINKESVEKWKTTQTDLYTDLEGYTDLGFGDNDHPAPVSSNRLYEVDNTRPKYYNTNVHINKGATVTRYCYGGGLGHGNLAHSGNVYGTTYIDLLGGTVDFDLYAAGTSGSVKDSLGVKGTFIASSTAYIEGGKARNVYGGGWAGSVGHHNGNITTSYTSDIPGETHVIIGIDQDKIDQDKKAGIEGYGFYKGVPAIGRNAYGGGEGGAVWGTANITLRNGYIGYMYDATKSDDSKTPTIDERYVEKIEDETYRDDDGHFQSNKRLNDAGCIFGGGYIDNSSVDITHVKMYGGHVRNALFGGGEIAAIGRGAIIEDANDKSKRKLQGLYKAGSTNVELYEGYVHRNVFGGGRGYNNLGDGGSLLSDGFVFGNTLVNIYGGVIGTTEELLKENGNVFGGGDIGYVYSAYEGKVQNTVGDEKGNLYVGIKDGVRYDGNYEGYYYKYKVGSTAYIPGNKPADNDTNWVMDGTEYILTEDCKVLVEPHCKVKTACTINGHNYNVGDYVPTEDLNTLGNKNESKATWDNLDLTGIVIYNAVFAGGNTTKGSTNEAAFANSTSVYGNATASIHDVYNRDLISLGTKRVGGLYGDGNLTFVDGYRGLNITNYGTDYYTIQSKPQISIEEYNDDSKYSDRERDYYQITYICVQECTDDEGTTYFPKDQDHSNASSLTSDDILTLFQNNQDIVSENGVINQEYWKENGVCTIYAGRPMNTIQRADFCGVFGSRMVMQGAQDRVPEVIDYTRYTINRVREVSLNKKKYNETSADYHGNYFGIYSVVNYLGALTSDVDFQTGVRETDNSDKDTYKKTVVVDGVSKSYGTATYQEWKQANRNNRTRNNGISHNKVALASGVYLELTTERGTGDDLYEKDWGLITGVVELDLINVQTGLGGGFVYAKNEHGIRKATNKRHVTLTALNQGAVSSDDFEYKTLTTSEDAKKEWETSGNFVHGEQVIIDDCYNISAKYKGSDAVPAHYWYIQGSVYVYDQYISVYTGVPNAYSETVEIPLTITAASNGTMRLLDVKPNKYAYYNANGQKLGDEQKLNINDVTYQLNDSISYWDWYKLTKTEQKLFVDETFVVVEDCWIDSKEYKKGYVLLEEEYDQLKNKTVTRKIKDEHGAVHEEEVAFTKMFRSSNNMSHENGYILTYKVNNPKEWDTWYTVRNGAWNNKNQTGGNAYEDGPTYHLTSGTAEMLGQRQYSINSIIPAEVYKTYQAIKDDEVKSQAIPDPENQAEFERAWIVTEQIEIEGSGTHYNPGAVLSATEAAHYSGKVAEAYVCSKTIQLSNTEFIYVNSKMSPKEKNDYLKRVNDGIEAIAGSAISDMSELSDTQINNLTYDQKKELRTLLQTKKDITSQITEAYYCTKAGLYGGDYYEANKNYRGLVAWSSMSPEDRQKFTFNYDAFDLLIDPNYSKDPTSGNIIHGEGKKYQYDSAAATEEAAIANKAGYSLEQRVDYKATYNGSETSEYNGVTLEHNKEYSRTEYEKLPNEKRHYAPINVKEAGTTYYVVKSPVTINNKPYAVGSTITATEFGKLSEEDQNARISSLSFTTPGTYYYCRDKYTIGEKGNGVAVTSATGVTGATGGSYALNNEVPIGVVINDDMYSGLINKQTNFTIHGIAPMETSTFYVSRNSDIDDLSRGKIITVIYEYNYEESDESGAHITPISERHVLNIHITFKSGSPIVEDIDELPLVIPGNLLGLREPEVIPGATEVTGGGWELFETITDAESNSNGIPYTPNIDPLYWYQDGFWLKYYALSYIGGKTYSNKVKVKVANYHDLKKVIEAKEHHYYVDIPNLTRFGRVPKVYINDENNGMKQLKDLFDLSVLNPGAGDLDVNGLINSGTFVGHAPLGSQVNACDNLEFFMRTNVNHSGTWEPIGGGGKPCFSGTLHGDGHYISGLDHSLFGELCGDVYNLGVMGTFTEAGVANTGSGFVENCWVKTDATSGFATGDDAVMAVFGKPTSDAYTHVVNCYYQEAPYKSGPAKAMKPEALYNGTLAYDLNGFYLYKRYCDQKVGSGLAYHYYAIDKTTGELSELKTKYYADNLTYCSSGYNNEKYVEDRFADGDFRYAGGNIPETDEERLYVDTEGNSYFYPIWPDDYIFFGQMLTYRWNDVRPHEDVPSPIVKSNGRLQTSDLSNRVFRAPAYFRNSDMAVAHFNPSVNLVAYSKPRNSADTDLKAAYPGMTAIDFAGHNDLSQGYKLGLDGTRFYSPLLDDDGLLAIVNRDETPNLLVYAPAATAGDQGGYANMKTYGKLTDYFKEPAFSSYDEHYYSDGNNYNRVSVAPTSNVVGHLVLNDFTTATDHLLVDKQDFNAPIAYEMGSGKRMWYQRAKGDYRFVTTTFSTSGGTTTKSTIGWNGVSLPFSAEIVTTDVKGELTHFYQGSTAGHEYWLREFVGGSTETVEGQNEGQTTKVFKGTFNYPDAVDNSSKDYTNTFLWDYYYSHEDDNNVYVDKDRNTDEYQKTYYSTSHTYSKYPYSQGGTPYLVGFPGKTYYEFDLSGKWTPENRYKGETISSPGEQVITFASATGAPVAKSDSETGTTADGYTYKTNYLNQVLVSDAYVMNEAGSSFDLINASTSVSAFRPYFVKSDNTTGETRSVIFGNEQSELKGVEEHGDPTKEEINGGLRIWTKKDKIFVESTLSFTEDVRVVTPAGITVASFSVKSGQTVEVQADFSGIYVVHTLDGRYIKKLSVKK